MKISWVTRSFLDYRIPVYKALNDLCGGNLTLIYNGNVVPKRVQAKIKNALGLNAVSLYGEKTTGGSKRNNQSMANSFIRIPYQPKLIKTIRNTRPDVIISDGFFQWTYAALLVRIFNLKGIKHVMCYERTEHTERNAGKLRTLYREFVSIWIDAIDCNGSLTETYVRKIGYKKPITIGHMVADVDGLVTSVGAVADSLISEIKVANNIKGVVFLYVGQIIPRKGIMEMLKAWHAANLSDATLVLVGGGEQQELAESYIKDHNITTVRVLGAIDYDQIAQYYKAADCFIIPTLEDNWSLVVPEAMSCGLPVMCSKYNGCYPELATPDNGWVFDPLNQQNFIDTLQSVIKSKDKLKAMGECSRQIVSNHTPQTAAQSIYDACMMVLNKK